MARFKYVAKDMSGKVHKGTVEAASENALTQQLREENLYLVEAKDLNGAKSIKVKSEAACSLLPGTVHTSGIRRHACKGARHHFRAGRNEQRRAGYL
mgnify:CR=1 FL=1